MTQVKVESDNTDLLPRKQPTQGRSRKTVEKILAATRRILERDGHRSLTTIAVAEESGVTVGSIYQYFPTKHAIVYALYTNWLDDIVRELDQITDDHDETASPYGALRKIFAAFIEDTQTAGLWRELTAAMNAHPELLDVEAAHQQRIARRISTVLKEISPEIGDQTRHQFAIGLYRLSTTLMDVVSDAPPEEHEAMHAWAEATAASAVENMVSLTK